jgi:hypothetical protein
VNKTPSMIQLQSIANDIRDRLLENEAIRRLRVEVLWAAGNPDALTIRARHRDRVLTVERGGRWHQRPAEQQAAELAHELVSSALDTLRPAPAPPRWRRPASDSGGGRTRPDIGSNPSGPTIVGP